MNDFQWLINQRALEKRRNFPNLGGERARTVNFDEWTLHEYGIKNPRQVPLKERCKMYREYQQAMIAMHFLEWDSAKYWGLPTYLNLFGR